MTKMTSGDILRGLSCGTSPLWWETYLKLLAEEASLRRIARSHSRRPPCGMAADAKAKWEESFRVLADHASGFWAAWYAFLDEFPKHKTQFMVSGPTIERCTYFASEVSRARTMLKRLMAEDAARAQHALPAGYRCDPGVN
jgi:hypothetical protein